MSFQPVAESRRNVNRACRRDVPRVGDVTDLYPAFGFESQLVGCFKVFYLKGQLDVDVSW